MLVTRAVDAPEQLNPTSDQLAALSAWLTVEVEDALASRFFQERVWRDSLRLYEGVPKNPNRVPAIPGMMPLEVTIGAIAVDSIYAQSLDLVYSISPVVTVRSSNPIRDNVEDAKAMQEFANRVAKEMGLRTASEETLLDDVQLGTGVYYVPWVEEVKKVRSYEVRSKGPRAFYLPIEDFLVPAVAHSMYEYAPWIGLRFWLTEGEIALRAKVNPRWDIQGISHAGDTSWVRNRRETIGHQSNTIARRGNIYEIWDLYVHYDIDGDGIEEDLYIVWDRTSRKVIDAMYNPFDKRPVSVMVYQRRAGLAYGLGVMEMLRPYQEEVTEVHVHRTVNMMLANTRVWKTRSGLLPGNFRVIPGRIIQLDDPDSFQGEQMADVYPSSAQAEAITLSLAERRAGVNELALPRPSQVLGSRTPGITALSLLQQQSRRFTAAFDGMRLATADAVKQGLYRYHERVMAGDTEVIDYIFEVMGQEQGQRIVTVLGNRGFLQDMEVEMTASSASINKEADRQSAAILVNILAQYYQRTIELVTIAANPAVPPQVREVAARIATIVGEVIERTVRTFDQVRDPQTFVVQVEDLVNQEQVAPDALAQLIALTGQGAQQGGLGQGDSGQPAASPEFPQ